MNVDGSDVRRLTNRVGYDGGAFFSPDGRRSSGGRCTRRPRPTRPTTAAPGAAAGPPLAARAVGGQRRRQRRRARSPGWAAPNFAPFFHPDGRRIIFASNHATPRGRNFDLYLVNVDGSGLEQVTTSGEFDGFPMFSPDGRRLVFASNRNAANPGETNLFIADWVE